MYTITCFPSLFFAEKLKRMERLYLPVAAESFWQPPPAFVHILNGFLIQASVMNCISGDDFVSWRQFEWSVLLQLPRRLLGFRGVPTAIKIAVDPSFTGGSNPAVSDDISGTRKTIIRVKAKRAN